MNKLQRLQDEIIEVQIRIRDLEEQRTLLRKQLNSKLSYLLQDKKTLKKVRPIDSFSRMGSDASNQKNPRSVKTW
jgi:hypothetical protein